MNISVRDLAWLLSEKHNGRKTDEYKKDVERLCNGEPLAYVIGHVPFLKTTIHLDSRPLIPRPETEYWTELAIKEIEECGNVSLSVLDLCAGSGCIGISVLKALPNASVDFGEVEPTHIETIEKNLTGNAISFSRTHCFSSDLFQTIPQKKYDYILTNPPYIDLILSNRVERSVTEHEPSKALFGGVDGMEYIRRIIADAREYLKEGGILFIEHEPEQADQIQKYASTHHYESSKVCEDQFDVLRFSRLVASSRQ